VRAFTRLLAVNVAVAEMQSEVVQEEPVPFDIGGR
jgi:hypothetical protein